MTKRTRKSPSRKVKSEQPAERRSVARERIAVVGKQAGTRTRTQRITDTKGEQPAGGYRSVPATQAKNRFGDILLSVRDSGPVFIERHGQAQAVVLSIEAYRKLTSKERSSQERELDYWTREFDALHARMQTAKARKAVDALFSASEVELNRTDR